MAPRQLAEVVDRDIEKLGIGRKGDVLRLHRGVRRRVLTGLLGRFHATQYLAGSS